MTSRRNSARCGHSDEARPLFKPGLADADPLRHTRWMTEVSGVIRLAMTLWFRSVASAWIFVRTVLLAIVRPANLPALGVAFSPAL